MSQNAAPFKWGDIHLTQAVFIDGIPHFTRQAIGEWLEYAEPRKSIAKIIDRNAYLDAYSVVVNLTTTDGKNYEVNVYHPIGFLLIVMESGQPRAQAMKVAVAEFVWHFAGPQPLSHTERRLLRKQRVDILGKIGGTANAFVCRELVSDLRDVSLALGVPVGAPDALPGFNQPSLPGVE